MWEPSILCSPDTMLDFLLSIEIKHSSYLHTSKDLKFCGSWLEEHSNIYVGDD